MPKARVSVTIDKKFLEWIDKKVEVIPKESELRPYHPKYSETFLFFTFLSF